MRTESKGFKKYRLGLDLGSNSVGFAAVQSEGLSFDTYQPNEDIFQLGSHIFGSTDDSEGKKVLANQKRAGFRRARKTLRRSGARREKLYKLFFEIGALPEDFVQRTQILTRHTHNGVCDQPLILRKRALDEELSLEQIAKAICHLNRRRGYLSTRDLMTKGIPPEYLVRPRQAEPPEEEGTVKTDTVDEKKAEVRQVLHGISAAYQAIDSGLARTYGELMADRMMAGQFTRHYTKRFDKKGPAKETEHEKLQRKERLERIAPLKLSVRADRALTLAEFHKIYDFQQKFKPNVLTNEFKKQLQEAIFHQNELTGSEDLRKHCPAYRSALCSPKTSDAFQRNRILSDLINNFEIGPAKKAKSKTNVADESERVPFSPDQIALFLQDLMDGLDLTVAEIIERTGLSPDLVRVKPKTGIFRRGFVYGHQTRRLLRELTNNDYANWSDEVKTKVQDIINSALWPKDAYVALQNLQFPDPLCAAIATAPFIEGYGEYSTKFLNAISDRMLEHGEHEAIARDYLFLKLTGERLEAQNEAVVPDDPDTIHKTSLVTLPENFNLRNPVVERGIRRSIWVINQIIYRYGLPEVIRIELPRELTMANVDKAKLEKAMAENEKERLKAIAELKAANLPATGINIKKLRLLKETGYMLLYEGKTASIQQLNELEIDHAYPRSKVYVSDNRNLVLCFASTNREKGNKVLWDYFSQDEFAQYQTRVKCCKTMSKGKRAWLCADKDPDDQWLASQLNSTGYIAKELKKILSQLGVPIEVSTGRATAMLRWSWGLADLFPDWLGFAKALKEQKRATPKKEEDENEPKKKGRSDHRHHAIDALVVALTSVSTYQQISRLYKSLQPDERIDWSKSCPIPGLQKLVQSQRDNIAVTSQFVQKVTGELHKQQAQKEDLKKIPGSLRAGAPNSSLISGGLLIRYDQSGTAAQAYPLENNHHVVVYKSRFDGKKGVPDFRVEIVTMIEVALRAKRKERVIQPSKKMLDEGYDLWLTLQKGEIVELSSENGRLYQVGTLSVKEGVLDIRFRFLPVGAKEQELETAVVEVIDGKLKKLAEPSVEGHKGGLRPIVRFQSNRHLALIVRKVKLNAFGEVVHQEIPGELS